VRQDSGAHFALIVAPSIEVMTLGKHHFQALVQTAIRMAAKLSCGGDAEQLDLLPQNQ
jgi:hypothetical protein